MNYQLTKLEVVLLGQLREAHYKLNVAYDHLRKANGYSPNDLNLDHTMDCIRESSSERGEIRVKFISESKFNKTFSVELTVTDPMPEPSDYYYYTIKKNGEITYSYYSRDQLKLLTSLFGKTIKVDRLEEHGVEIYDEKSNTINRLPNFLFTIQYPKIIADDLCEVGLDYRRNGFGTGISIKSDVYKLNNKKK